MDEADAMFRTAGRTQVFEQALQQLLNLGPSMTVMISASKFNYNHIICADLIINKDRPNTELAIFLYSPCPIHVGAGSEPWQRRRH